MDCTDEKASKHVESAIHKANLPGITPQKMGANTLKIPVPRQVPYLLLDMINDPDLLQTTV